MLPKRQWRRKVADLNGGLYCRQIPIESFEQERTKRILLRVVARTGFRPIRVVALEHRLHDRVPGRREARVFVVHAHVELFVRHAPDRHWFHVVDEQGRGDARQRRRDAIAGEHDWPKHLPMLHALTHLRASVASAEETEHRLRRARRGDDDIALDDRAVGQAHPVRAIAADENFFDRRVKHRFAAPLSIRVDERVPKPGRAPFWARQVAVLQVAQHHQQDEARGPFGNHPREQSAETLALEMFRGPPANRLAEVREGAQIVAHVPEARELVAHRGELTG